MTSNKPKRPYLGLMIAAGTIIILVLLLLAAVIIFIVVRSNTTDSAGVSLLTNTSPLTKIEVAQVDPALALASLGGVPEAEVITEAINKERPETALAALLYQPNLEDRTSAGDLLRLAGAYTQPQPQKARFCYQMAGTVTTLSPSIPDMVRADLFLQVAEGLLKLNEPAWGKFYLDQAFVVATRSPYFQAVHRRAILERLQKHYISLGERELARKSLDLSVNAPDITSPNEEKVYIPPRAALPLPQLIQTVEITRWLKAQELAAQLVERGGHAPSANIKALQEALVAEDQQKLPFYASELSSAAQVSKKIDITQAKIEWLSIKYRVARRAYGLSLVPDWERQADMIRADLTKTYETLYSLYADFIVALPEAGQLDQATAEKLRREVLAGELGRYPNYPQEQRRKQLLEITQQLMTEQPELNIFVGTQTVAGQETYTLQTVK